MGEQQLIHVANGHLHTAIPCSQLSFVVTKQVSFNQKQWFINVSMVSFVANIPKRYSKYVIQVAHGYLLSAIPCSRSSFVVPKRTRFNQNQRYINVSISYMSLNRHLHALLDRRKHKMSVSCKLFEPNNGPSQELLCRCVRQKQCLMAVQSSKTSGIANDYNGIWFADVSLV